MKLGFIKFDVYSKSILHCYSCPTCVYDIMTVAVKDNSQDKLCLLKKYEFSTFCGDAVLKGRREEVEGLCGTDSYPLPVSTLPTK